MQIFSPDGKFMTVLNRAADIFLLNLLWFLFSIPIVTMGAATTAKYAVAMKVVRGKEPLIWKEFIKSFKLNVKQGIIIWIPMLFMALFMGYEVLFVMGMQSTNALVFMILLLVLYAIVLLMMMFGFPMLARFDTTVKMWFRNSLILAIMNLPVGIMLLALSLAPYILIYYYPQWLVIWLAIPIISVYINSTQCVRILKKLEPADYIDPEETFIEDSYADEEVSASIRRASREDEFTEEDELVVKDEYKDLL